MFKNKSYTLPEAISRLESYCAYQDRCHKEVKTKLRQMRMIPQAIDHITTHLIKHNYLNEERFARSFTRGKFRIKKWGRLRISRELKLRDISRYNINIALQEIDDAEYLNTFHELAEKEYKRLYKLNKGSTKRKLYNYLIYRGWETHMIYEKLNQLSKLYP